jgi:hypothetical protein
VDLHPGVALRATMVVEILQLVLCTATCPRKPSICHHTWLKLSVVQRQGPLPANVVVKWSRRYTLSS